MALEIDKKLEISSVVTLVKDHLKLSKMSVKGISRLIKPELKEKRLFVVTKFLQHYEK